MEKYYFKQKGAEIQKILDKAAALPNAEELAGQVRHGGFYANNYYG